MISLNFTAFMIWTVAHLGHQNLKLNVTRVVARVGHQNLKLNVTRVVARFG